MINILWVDDEIDLLKPHIIFLEKKQYNVTTCQSGTEALEIIDDTNFDINEILAGGQEVLKLEKAFNQRAGITKAQDRLPEFFKEEAVGPHNVTFDFTDEELDKTLEF